MQDDDRCPIFSHEKCRTATSGCRRLLFPFFFFTFTIHNHTSASGVCPPSNREELWTQTSGKVTTLTTPWSLHEFWQLSSPLEG